MSRLGTWRPQSAEERLDRMESLAELHQLVARYAVALDSRDMDTMVSLFEPDVRVGRDTSGRAALKEWFDQLGHQFRSSVHFVGNHVVDFQDADHATGIVYCHDELDWVANDRWEQGKLQYWDSYVRLDGEWLFHRRKFLRWYLVDALERPAHGAGMGDGQDRLTTEQLPEAFPTYRAFWGEEA
jgi:hypothetical protein